MISDWSKMTYVVLPILDDEEVSVVTMCRRVGLSGAIKRLEEEGCEDITCTPHRSRDGDEVWIVAGNKKIIKRSVHVSDD